jgi:hypothetical protein
MTDVLRADDIDYQELLELLARYQLCVTKVADNDPIPGSFWGDDEAGLILNTLYLRGDTPVHSILHESCHFICIDENRRRALDTNAKSDIAEENAVCYLQILLSDQLSGMGRARMLSDMDRWGYSFRLGSAKAWFESDAEDAADWLLKNHLIDCNLHPAFQLRLN